MKIVIIGKGNVAVNLQHAFQVVHIDSEMVSSREGLDAIRQDADVYIYAVKDTALAQVVSQVHVPVRALHLHTSGTMPITVFGDDKPHAGILYPFQTFSKTHILEDFSRVPLFIEGKDIDDVAAIFTLAQSLSSLIYEANQHDRERLHVAGVMANNFSNAMFHMAQQMLRETHIPFQALLPIIDQTAAKVHSLSPYDAQTGPARRGDRNVIQHHEDLITDPRVRDIYRLISEYILTNYGTSE